METLISDILFFRISSRSQHEDSSSSPQRDAGVQRCPPTNQHPPPSSTQPLPNHSRSTSAVPTNQRLYHNRQPDVSPDHSSASFFGALFNLNEISDHSHFEVFNNCYYRISFCFSYMYSTYYLNANKMHRLNKNSVMYVLIIIFLRVHWVCRRIVTRLISDGE